MLPNIDYNLIWRGKGASGRPREAQGCTGKPRGNPGRPGRHMEAQRGPGRPREAGGGPGKASGGPGRLWEVPEGSRRYVRGLGSWMGHAERRLVGSQCVARL